MLLPFYKGERSLWGPVHHFLAKPCSSTNTLRPARSFRQKALYLTKKQKTKKSEGRAKVIGKHNAPAENYFLLYNCFLINKEKHNTKLLTSNHRYQAFTTSIRNKHLFQNSMGWREEKKRDSTQQTWGGFVIIYL